MKTVQTIHYDDIIRLKKSVKVKKLYCVPVFQEGLNDEEIDALDMTHFIFVGKRNWDRYFTKKVDIPCCEEFNDVCISKTPLEESLYDTLDYIAETDTFMYVNKN